MFSEMQMQYRTLAVDKMNIEPAMISTESCKSFSVFLKFQMDDRWLEYMELIRKQRNGGVKLNLSSRWLFVSFWPSSTNIPFIYNCDI